MVAGLSWGYSSWGVALTTHWYGTEVQGRVLPLWAPSWSILGWTLLYLLLRSLIQFTSKHTPADNDTCLSNFDHVEYCNHHSCYVAVSPGPVLVVQLGNATVHSVWCRKILITSKSTMVPLDHGKSKRLVSAMCSSVHTIFCYSYTLYKRFSIMPITCIVHHTVVALNHKTVTGGWAG